MALFGKTERTYKMCVVYVLIKDLQLMCDSFDFCFSFFPFVRPILLDEILDATPFYDMAKAIFTQRDTKHVRCNT